jgi:pre-rRNA-processing protein TSR3
VEALAGALYILGERVRAAEVLSKISWGIRFIEVNQEPLELYSGAKDSTEIIKIQEMYI